MVHSKNCDVLVILNGKFCVSQLARLCLCGIGSRDHKDSPIDYGNPSGASWESESMALDTARFGGSMGPVTMPASEWNVIDMGCHGVLSTGLRNEISMWRCDVLVEESA